MSPAPDRPVLFFDSELPPAFADLVAGRAEVAGPDEGLERADAVIAGARITWDAERLAGAPSCRVVSRLGVGYDNVDVAGLADVGVVVCNAPDAPTVSTAEHTVALMLAITKDLPSHTARAEAGLPATGTGTTLELDGATLGLIGFGRIARRVAVTARALGMTVLAHDPFLTEATIDGVGLTDLRSLAVQSDVLSLHAPADPTTYRLVDAELLRLLKPGAHLVNCARGSLVDHDALLDALDRGHLAGAALDVTDPEPLPVGHPLLGHERVIVTPHVASSTAAGRRRLYEHAIDNALAVLDGRPASVVAPPPI